MTTDGTSLIMSDGTNILTFLDPNTLKQTKTLNITNAGYAEDNINELEYIDGKLYANVYGTNRIVVIDIKTGAVEAEVDLGKLVPKNFFKDDWRLYLNRDEQLWKEKREVIELRDGEGKLVDVVTY